jgi:hypothetical protein
MARHERKNPQFPMHVRFSLRVQFIDNEGKWIVEAHEDSKEYALSQQFKGGRIFPLVIQAAYWIIAQIGDNQRRLNSTHEYRREHGSGD